MPTPRPFVALAAALVASLPLAAQTLALRDPIRMEPHMLAYDTARSRLVRVGRQGETRELDGTAWLLRPGPGPRLYGALAYRTAARRVCAFGTSYTLGPETWEYDGAGWQRRNVPVQPPARFQFAMTCDSTRDRVLLFGGTSVGGTILGDTWLWDGTGWTQATVPGPSARVHASLAFDAARGCAVLFGGRAPGGTDLGDTWEWIGVAWRVRTPLASPPPRHKAAMAFDPVRSRTVLHGGYAGGVSGETWEYDGATWVLAATAGGPGPSWGHDLVFDDRRGESLLVGGAGSAATEVWQWNGSRWLATVRGSIAPPASLSGAAAGDPLHGGILQFGSMFSGDTTRFAQGSWSIAATAQTPAPRFENTMWSDGASAWLFGGWHSLFGTWFNDTWRWTTAGWQLRPTAASPSPRANAAVAFDVVRGNAVLFGGGAATALDDTWTFDGTTWQRRTPATVPPARIRHGLAFDPASGRVLMFGGRGGALLADTWAWNGTDWASVPTPTSPPAHGAAAMHFDVRIGRMLMTTAPWSDSLVPWPIEAWTFDGVTWSRVPLLEERVAAHRHSLAAEPGSGRVFVVDGTVLEIVHQPGHVAPHGTDCGAGSPRLAARALPELGSATFGFDLLAAPPSGFAAIGGSATAGSAPVGGCTLLLARPEAGIVLATDAYGFATHVLAVPPSPSLRGGQWFFQAGVLQPTAPGGGALSAALRVVVGD